ncbi:MAG: DNA repair protein RadA [Pseudomonadota bacterium]
MTKSKTVYVCRECGSLSGKWSGQCSECGSWNSLEESAQSKPGSSNRFAGFAPSSVVQNLAEVQVSEITRIPSGSKELDRVLGGGMVPGSVVLIGGDPGIGKSTLLLQSMALLADTESVLYVSGEESAEQIALRAHRLGLPSAQLKVMAENRLESTLETVQREQPTLVVADSIQTFYSDELTAAPGSVSQVRECASRLVRFAKQTNCTVVLVGHVTKEGALAGPRILEHMVDCVLYFEGDSAHSFRVIRAIKNRFGAVNEIGVFAMTDRGLKDVANPSAMFINKQEANRPGSVVLASQEGSRPILVEVQALVDDSVLSNPRRLTIGLEQNRLAMLLAICHRHADISLNGYDVFTNVAGGIRISEPGADLAILLSVISSLKNRALGNDLVVFGEIGLSGELRAVQRGQERLREAAKMGFKRALIPEPNTPRKVISNMELFPVKRIDDALSVFEL